MKKISHYIMLLLLAVTMPLLTSCFKDSDADHSQNILDEKEVAEYLKKMEGTYSGKCHYTYVGSSGSGAPSLKEDSVDNIKWTLRENGEMTISKLPVSMFAKALKFGSQFGFLADEIAKCEDITLETKVLPFRTPDGWNYPFAIYPKENIVLNLKNEGRNYKVVLYYHNIVQIMGLYFEMQGICRVHENQMLMTLPIGSSSVNEVQTGAEPSLFRYIGAKKDKK